MDLLESFGRAWAPYAWTMAKKKTSPLAHQVAPRHRHTEVSHQQADRLTTRRVRAARRGEAKRRLPDPTWDALGPQLWEKGPWTVLNIGRVKTELWVFLLERSVQALSSSHLVSTPNAHCGSWFQPIPLYPTAICCQIHKVMDWLQLRAESFPVALPTLRHSYHDALAVKGGFCAVSFEIRKAASWFNSSKRVFYRFLVHDICRIWICRTQHEEAIKANHMDECIFKNVLIYQALYLWGRQDHCKVCKEVPFKNQPTTNLRHHDERSATFTKRHSKMCGRTL